MTSAALDREMSNYFMQLSIAEKKSVIHLIKTFLKKDDKSSERISIDLYNNEIDATMEEVRQGKKLTHEEVKRMSENW